ncbi:hypothetical protein DSL72_007714 [Monilinia vaccinii-corymbosi]|uniref:Uncharacterized protein n=1 Tax=Monilinia vaccinii-corymbosi TaxID=61207 RepID=A0A8A3PIJ5_9HELO|nr:hypothetical protein DSL72_007714 [Monilinia vaccinii-corymbosi]
MHLNQSPFLVFAAGTGLCNGSLLRHTSRPSSSSSASGTPTAFEPFISSSTLSPDSQPEVTPPPSITESGQIAGIIPAPAECNGFLRSASRAISSDLASTQLMYLSASSAIYDVRSSASSALASCRAERTNDAQGAALAMGAGAGAGAGTMESSAERAAVQQLSNATVLPVTLAVVLIVVTSFASSILSVLVYRCFSRRKVREREVETEKEEGDQQRSDEKMKGQNARVSGYYGGWGGGGGGGEGGGGGGVARDETERKVQSFRKPDAQIPAFTYPPIINPGFDRASAPPRDRYTSRYAMPLAGPAREIAIDQDYDDETPYVSLDIIDIEREIADMDHQLRMAEAELARREREGSISTRWSDDGLSRSSKSISVLFNPRDGNAASGMGGPRRPSGARSIVSRGLGIGERLRSMVLSSSRLSASQSQNGKRRDSSRGVGDRELEEGEEIIFTLDERALERVSPRPRQTHAYKNSDASIIMLSPSVYDGGGGGWNGKKEGEKGKGMGRGGDGEGEKEEENGGEIKKEKEKEKEKERNFPFTIYYGEAF